MGNAVQVCEELEKKVQILQNEVEKLQEELNTQMNVNSPSSPDSITSPEVNKSVIAVPASCTNGRRTSVQSKNRLMSVNNAITEKVKVRLM